jgi:hypothetical protein
MKRISESLAQFYFEGSFFKLEGKIKEKLFRPPRGHVKNSQHLLQSIKD